MMIKKLFASTLLLVLASCGSKHRLDAQAVATPAPAVEVMQPTELETLKVEAQGKDLQIIQLQYAANVRASADAQQAANNSLAAFNAISADLDKQVVEIKKAHKWGDDVTFNRATHHFERTMKAEPKKEANTEPKVEPKK